MLEKVSEIQTDVFHTSDRKYWFNKMRSIVSCSFSLTFDFCLNSNLWGHPTKISLHFYHFMCLMWIWIILCKAETIFMILLLFFSQNIQDKIQILTQIQLMHLITKFQVWNCLDFHFYVLEYEDAKRNTAAPTYLAHPCWLEDWFLRWL